MKKNVRKILIGLLVILIVIQFFPPAKNMSYTISENDVSAKYYLPEDVEHILKTSCYDCHSNNTIYPWYSKVQPVGWWLNSHINEGKRGLNFSEFASYPIKRQYFKLEDLIDLVKKDEMPLKSYLLIHTYAKLNNTQKLAIVNWANSLRDTIKANYPADSLIRNKNINPH